MSGAYETEEPVPAAYDSPLLRSPQAYTQSAPLTEYQRWALGEASSSARVMPVNVPATVPVRPVAVQPGLPARNQTLQKDDWCRARAGWPASHATSSGWPVVKCTADGADRPLMRVFDTVHSKYN